MKRPFGSSFLAKMSPTSLQTNFIHLLAVQIPLPSRISLNLVGTWLPFPEHVHASSADPG